MRKNFIFIVMCACVFFTTQCDGVDNTETAPLEMPEETEEIPEMSDYSYLDWANEVYERIYERVKCPSPAKTGEEYDLVGTWKLTLRINGTDTVDCSCENVIYHFKPDQMLTVSIGRETGEDVTYDYDWGYPFCPLCLPLTPRPNLRMGSSEVYCWALPKIMYVYPQLKEKYIIDDPYEGPPRVELAGLIPLFEINWIFVRID